ncbi:hypothetical protein EJ05DRAFT_501369 [Pseudovirgaria hyperparasitica]|uniref:Uncharacterized protein n=1 Tax=Pseudovirgaria hyperparasitica TaxID=470096 RepID=A0A6A6W4B9_9PEZI|nr:uncharacterized protein EJ05DRAFT_501369 [Pseudovirgaria hyperparasitica]KAF2756816.1 hypothetical protein EJ05DRAFT_501369 [Pseudovirgaria hyperparasitica]
MAPVEPDVNNSNAIPIITLTSQALSIGALLVYIFAKLRVASKALPPSQDTRSRIPQRRRDITILAGLALLSFLIVSHFALSSRTISYQEWAQKSKEPIPNSLWSGWYGGTNGITGGLQLGRWFQDVNILSDGFQVAVARSRGFWWTQQQFTGLLGWSIFVGVEGRRRHLPKTLTFAFVLLGQLVGLSIAQNLFYIGLLLTPVPFSSTSQRSSLWTPHPGVYIAPIIASLVLLDVLPNYANDLNVIRTLMVGFFILPQVFAIGIHLAPARFGTTHRDPRIAHRSFTSVFYWFAIASFLLHAKHTVTAIIDNTPESTHTTYYRVWSKLEHQERTTYERSRTAVVRLLNALSDHPAVSVIGWDVLLSALSYSVWAIVRGLDVFDMLKCSAVPFITTPNDKEDSHHVHFKNENDEEEPVITSTPPISPKRTARGRPRKSSTASNDGKRSTRSRKSFEHEEDEGEAYVPPSGTSEELASTTHGESHTEEALVEEAEGAALAWGLFVLGGLGVASAGVLGAEVRGR